MLIEGVEPGAQVLQDGVELDARQFLAFAGFIELAAEVSHDERQHRKRYADDHHVLPVEHGEMKDLSGGKRGIGEIDDRDESACNTGRDAVDERHVRDDQGRERLRPGVR
ncbi:MAG: hypothetical protein ABR527_08810 [Gemmatimonadota bacterium]